MLKMGMGSGKSKSATTRHCPLIPLLNVNKTPPLNQPLYFADRNVRTLSHLEGVDKLSEVMTEEAP